MPMRNRQHLSLTSAREPSRESPEVRALEPPPSLPARGPGTSDLGPSLAVDPFTEMLDQMIKNLDEAAEALRQVTVILVEKRDA